MVTRLIQYFLLVTAVTSPAFSGKFKNFIRKAERFLEENTGGRDSNASWSKEKHEWDLMARNAAYTAYNYTKENEKYCAPRYQGEDFDAVLRNTENFPWTHETFKEILKAHNVPINETQSPKGQLQDFCAILALPNAVYEEDRKISNPNVGPKTKRSIAATFLRREYGPYLSGVEYYDAEACNFVTNGTVEKEKRPVEEGSEKEILELGLPRKIFKAEKQAPEDVFKGKSAKETLAIIEAARVHLEKIKEQYNKSAHNRIEE